MIVIVIVIVIVMVMEKQCKRFSLSKASLTLNSESEMDSLMRGEILLSICHYTYTVYPLRGSFDFSREEELDRGNERTNERYRMG